MDREVFQKKYGLIGESSQIHGVIDKIMKVAKTDFSVIIQGESGTGKEVTARAIHGDSERSSQNLVIINAGSIPEGTIESELFGHVKGSFTGADGDRVGYFEKANKGTIFLDEIGDTPMSVQVRLLRILENGEYYRVGSSKVSTTDVRVIAASNKDLWELVKKGEFREDLYHRLNTVQIYLPPLRDRKEDILPLFDNFVQEFSMKYDSIFRGMSESAKELLLSYRWPGNVRTLREVARKLVVFEKSKFIEADDLKHYLDGRQKLGSADNLPILSSSQSNQQSAFGTAENEMIFKALVKLSTEMTDVKTELHDLRNVLANYFYTNMANQDVQTTYLPPAKFERYEENDNLGLSSDVESGGSHFEQSEHEIPENIDPALLQFLGEESIPSLEATERFLIERALDKYDGNRRKASEKLGISERTLYRKIDHYGLE